MEREGVDDVMVAAPCSEAREKEETVPVAAELDKSRLIRFAAAGVKVMLLSIATKVTLLYLF